MHDTSESLPRLNLRGRQLYDLELLLVGGFDPLTGFMTEAEYQSVLDTMRLPDGAVFPMPITLDVSGESSFAVGQSVMLCDQFGNPLATMDITDRYTPNKKEEAEKVFGTTEELHPGVQYLEQQMHNTYIGGPVRQLALPKRHDFKTFRHTPDELKQIFAEKEWDKVVGFQTRNPMHRVHFELVKRAHEKLGLPVLVHPVVGMTKPGDIDYVTRVRTYNIVCNQYGKDFTYLSLLPLAMRMGGPREAVWHARVRKNYGCTHFIVGRDHAGPGSNAAGDPFYAPEAARELAEEMAPELGVTIVPSEEIVYAKSRSTYVPVGELAQNDEVIAISGTEFRRRLFASEEIPDWFSFPESIEVLRQSVRKDTRPGLVLFFTGLSGAGKSTIAELLLARLQELQDRNITFLDGDVIRDHLSKGLTFSKEDRDENVRRIGFVAAEVACHGGIAICSQIAPYKSARDQVRTMVEEHGTFIEVFVATPLAACEERDTKGLYAKARKGEIKNFTGVNDPYEEPTAAELVINTTVMTPEESVKLILDYLRDIETLGPET